MRSVIYGTLITLFLASAGIVQAGELDGKALLCTSKYTTQPVYGLVFDKGKVTKWQITGYSKSTEYNHNYRLDGTTVVRWLSYHFLNRETLKANNDQCAISSKTEIFRKLDEIISAAKKTNKI
jgi:hypothetical protein